MAGGITKRRLVSQREYARTRGVTHGAVQHAIKTGRVTTIDGKIDPAIADREWRANTDPTKPRNRITGRPKHTREPGGPPAPMDFGGLLETPGGDNGGGSGFARAHTARELYQAQLTKLALDRQRGTLVLAADVKVGAFNCARKARDQLMALPGRIAATLAATQEAPEVERILEQEIERICIELSDGERS